MFHEKVPLFCIFSLKQNQHAVQVGQNSPPQSLPTMWCKCTSKDELLSNCMNLATRGTKLRSQDKHQLGRETRGLSALTKWQNNWANTSCVSSGNPVYGRTEGRSWQTDRINPFTLSTFDDTGIQNSEWKKTFVFLDYFLDIPWWNRVYYINEFTSIRMSLSF